MCILINYLIQLLNTIKNDHRTIKVTPVYVTSGTYVDFGTKSSDKESKFEVGDQVRISKYKNIFVQFYAAN